MKILLINATKRKQTTYSFAKKYISYLGNNNQVHEIFLPKENLGFCKGCGNCFLIDEKLCPHFEAVHEIEKELIWADTIIFAVPTYVYHVPGSLKVMLDHFGYMWLIHRPKKIFQYKTAVVISTAAGGGTKSTVRDVVDSLDYWGIGRVLTYKKNVYASKLSHVSEKILQETNSKLKKLALINLKPIKRTRIKVKFLFALFKRLHKKHRLSTVDYDYWTQQGWL